MTHNRVRVRPILSMVLEILDMSCHIFKVLNRS
jgi:hypothetical protein